MTLKLLSYCYPGSVFEVIHVTSKNGLILRNFTAPSSVETTTYMSDTCDLVTSFSERQSHLELWGYSGANVNISKPRKMVKSGKLRSGTGSKLKRWKKGHSSDSNPQTSRFRQAAKSRYFSRPSGKSYARGSVARATLSLFTACLLKRLKLLQYTMPLRAYWVLLSCDRLSEIGLLLSSLAANRGGVQVYPVFTIKDRVKMIDFR